MRLFGAADALREAFDTPRPPRARASYDRTVAAFRAELSEEEFLAAWAEGRATSWKQAIAYALSGES